MAFIHRSGPCQVEWFVKTASTALSVNSALAWTSGQLVAATSTSTSIAGVALRGSASGDIFGDYASAVRIPVILPQPDTVFEADITGTLTAAMEGGQYDLNSDLVVNVGAQTHKQVTIVKFLSATKGLVKFSGAYPYRDAS